MWKNTINLLILSNPFLPVYLKATARQHQSGYLLSHLLFSTATIFFDKLLIIFYFAIRVDVFFTLCLYRIKLFFVVFSSSSQNNITHFILFLNSLLEKIDSEVIVKNTTQFLLFKKHSFFFPFSWLNSNNLLPVIIVFMLVLVFQYEYFLFFWQATFVFINQRLFCIFI